MAKIYEEILVIKLSTLVKDDVGVPVGTLASKDTISAIEQVAQELAGEGVIVEVERA